MISWSVVLWCIIPAYAVQVFLHEASHAAAALLQGAKIEVFKVWPHLHKIGGVRYLYFGRVRYSHIPEKHRFGLGAVVRAGAPFVSGTILWVALGFAAIFTLPASLPLTYTAILTMMGATTVDLSRNLISIVTGNPNKDIHKVFFEGDIPGSMRWIPVACGTCLVLVYISLVVAGLIVG